MLKDKIDEKILDYLKNDSRESFVEIGKKLKLSESAVRRRVKNLVDGKVIERFTIEMGEMNCTSAIVLIFLAPLGLPEFPFEKTHQELFFRRTHIAMKD